MLTATLLLFALAFLTLLLAWTYFRRFAIERPPIGVINLWDVTFIMIFIILIPYLYLWLPNWAVITLLGLSTLSLLHLVWQPILRRRAWVWLAALLPVILDVIVALRFGAHSTTFFAINNAVLILVAVGVSNIWAQSGMKARDLALLATLLALYDFIFTSRLSLMGDLFTQLSDLPFAPFLAWPIDTHGNWLGLGLGDLLIAATAPLVLYKAFGRVPGLAGFGLTLIALGVVMALPLLGLTVLFPVMVVLGPLILVQYLFWQRRIGFERTTRMYLAAEFADT